MEEALAAIKSRHSSREFLAEAVDKAIIEDIIDCARLAPTARGEQPWEFVVVTDKFLLERIATLATTGRFIAQAPVCVAVFCRATTYYLEDGAAATENILLAATAYDLGCCWVAGDKKAYAEEIRTLLGVPEGYKLVSLIPLGRVKPATPKAKRPLSEVLHWERFGKH
jgi:nitroreductase